MAGEQLSKPIPGTIGAIFGGLWASIAAMALPPAWQWPAALAFGVVTAFLIARLWRNRVPASQGERLFGRKAYQIAVVLEILAIYAASALLARLGLEVYLIEVVGIIVGLHFIGLWLATRSTRFLGIAAGMTIISALSLLLPATVGLVQVREVALGLGNALVLWLGSGWQSTRSG